MQIKFLATGLAAALWLAGALPATAQDAKPYHGVSEQQRQEVRERWDQMSEAEREAHRAEMQKRWEAMSPEEREAHRQQMRNPNAADPHQGIYGKGYGKSQGEADPKGKDKAKAKDKAKDKDKDKKY
jgi:hypothetical protein